MNQELHPMENWLLLNAESLQVSLFFIVFGILAVVEIYLPFRNRGTQKASRWLVNIGLTTINILLLSMLPVSFFTVSLLTSINGVGVLNLLGPPLSTSFVLTLLLRGFISFITHWLMHKVPLLWRVHRVHHLDTELDVSTTVRFHPLEFVVGLMIGIPLVAVFGLSPYSLLFYEILDAVVTLFSHANIRIPRYLEQWLHYIIATPDLHRVHHSAYHVETDSNFSAVFPVWDMVFGTFRIRTRQDSKSMKLGLNEVRDKRSHNLGWLITSPFVNIEGRTRKRRKLQNESQPDIER